MAARCASAVRQCRHCSFFFSSRRRHTRWTGDWSSYVCSSDLGRCSRRWPASTWARCGGGRGRPGAEEARVGEEGGDRGGGGASKKKKKTERRRPRGMKSREVGGNGRGTAGGCPWRAISQTTRR